MKKIKKIKRGKKNKEVHVFEKNFCFFDIRYYLPAQNCRVLVLFASGAVKETEFDTKFGFKHFSDFGFGITHFSLLPSLLPGQFIGIVERNEEVEFYK